MLFPFRLRSELSVGCLKDNVNAATYRCFEVGTTINEIQEYLWPSEHRTPGLHRMSHHPVLVHDYTDSPCISL
jgi:hypothetical protein